MVLLLQINSLQTRPKPSIMFLKMKIILSAWSLDKKGKPRFEGGKLNYRITFGQLVFTTKF